MQSMMVTFYKCFNGMAPSYLRAYIQEWGVSNYNLRGYFMLEIRHARASSYGLRSFRYYNLHAWNDLSDDIRKSDTIAGKFETKYHKRKIIDYIYYEFFFLFLFGFYIMILSKITKIVSAF